MSTSDINMHYLSNFCCLCLMPSQNLKNISTQDNDGLIVEQKMKLFLFELVNYKPYIHKFVCNNCLGNVNYVYKFKTMCLKNMAALKDYVQKQEARESNKNMNYSIDHRVELENQNNTNTKENEILQSNTCMADKNIYNKQETKESNSTIQKNYIQEYNEVNAPEEVYIKTEIEDKIETDDSYLSHNEDVQENHVIVKQEQEDDDHFQAPYETFQQLNEEKCIGDVTNTDNTESDSRILETSTNIQSVSEMPYKTKTRYKRTYEVFLKWCRTKNIHEINENLMLVYFSERSKILKSPASLWSEYSMLKLTIAEQKQEDISKYKGLKAFLKRKNTGYQPRKCKIFAKEQIEKFIADAPNEIYLMMKIVAILAVTGSCRTDELHRMKFKDIDVKTDIAIVKILETKNNKRRSFAITNSETNWLQLLQNYVQRRPQNAEDERFFYRYERGRSFRQMAGKQSISKVPREIAKFLKLDNESEYTGHSFKKTMSTFLSNMHNFNAR